MVVLFSVTDTSISVLPEPEADDNVIQEASFVAVQLAFVAIEILFVAAADETEILEGETVGASTLAPFCITVISWLREPEERPVNDTVTDPVRLVVLVFGEVLTVIEFPLVVTVIQLSLFDAVNDPSVETLTVLDPPAAS